MDLSLTDRVNRWTVRGIVAILALGLLAPTAVSAVTYEPTNLQKGTIESPANGTTVIAVQGFKVAGQDSGKKPARLVAVGPRGNVRWTYDGGDRRISWFYDVDPLDNGTVLITGARPGETIVAEYDPESGDTIWWRTFDWTDTHDVDLINGDQLLVANMRNYNETTGRNNDRLLVYDLSKDEVVWEWRFRNHGYNRSGGGSYTDDWTHVNDVDKIGDGRYLASPRNFDQAIVVDRQTGNVTMRLGSDDDHSVMYEQHNPQYLEGKEGTPTMLVADSENDRIVEYAKTDDGWTRTWTLTGDMNWPRDADRLPNGNTLVTDSLNHRVMEVTPTGEVVWEFYAPWGTYEAERMAYGDEHGGPTIREQGATGNYTLSGSANVTAGTGGQQTFAEWLTTASAGTLVESEVAWFAARWAHVTPWIRPVWMGPWDFVRTLLAGVLLLGWLGGEGITNRRRLVQRLQTATERIR